MGKLEGAYDDIRKAITLDKDNYEYKSVLAKIYLDLGNYDYARNLYEKIIHVYKTKEVRDCFVSANKFLIEDINEIPKDEINIEEKIKKVVTKVYGGAKVTFAQGVKTKIKKAVEIGMGNAPICMAKTQYSFSDDPKKLGAPDLFTLTVRDIRISRGAGFIVVLTGEIMTMPGLPKESQAEKIDVTEDGRIVGLL